MTSMLRRFILGAVALAFTNVSALADTVTAKFSAYTAGAGDTVDHAIWDRLLKAHVTTGADGVSRLPYAKLKSTAVPDIKAYIAALQAVAVSRLDRPEQQAYWVNLYNAVTLDAVLARYPVKSINDVGLKDESGAEQQGPWKAKLTTVEGMALSLDDIENRIVRPVFKDARAHYVLNCLSIGCPNLQPYALTGANLATTYEQAARTFVNHPRAIAIGADGKVTASSIYDWFVDDFGGRDGVFAHLAQHAGPDLKARLATVKSIDAYEYDWALADAMP